MTEQDTNLWENKNVFRSLPIAGFLEQNNNSI